MKFHVAPWLLAHIANLGFGHLPQLELLPHVQSHVDSWVFMRIAKSLVFWNAYTGDKSCDMRWSWSLNFTCSILSRCPFWRRSQIQIRWPSKSWSWSSSPHTGSRGIFILGAYSKISCFLECLHGGEAVRHALKFVFLRHVCNNLSWYPTFCDDCQRYLTLEFLHSRAS